MQLSFDSSVFEYFEDVNISISDRVFSVGLYWLSKDVISVNIRDNKELIVASDGWYNKLTYFISNYFYSDGLTINVNAMCTNFWCLFVW